MASWVFRNYGLIDQYQIETAEDLERIDELDRARWAATSAPIEQFQMDAGFLESLDADGNKRVRVTELIAAQKWVYAMLENRERLVQGSDTLVLADLAAGNPEAKKLGTLATLLLDKLDAPDRDKITLAQVRTSRVAYVAKFPNGDGVVTAPQVPAELQPLVAEIVAATGGADDLSGAKGVRAEDVKAYLDKVAAWLAWKERGVAEAATLQPLGDATDAGLGLVDALAGKVDQFFAQCALVRLEPGAADRLKATPEQLAALDVKSPAAIEKWLEEAPLAKPDPDGILPLFGAVNALYAARLERLSEDVAPKLLGRDKRVERLTLDEWKAIRAALAPYAAWKAGQPPGIDAKLGDEHLKALATAPGPTALTALAARDTTVREELVQITNLEKLVACQRWLFAFANNFVSFPALFSGAERTLFEMGTLVIDGRKVNLTVKVVDRAAHKAIAQTSMMFVVYLDLVRKTDGKEAKEQIAAAITAGTRGGIAVGKRGVFYDRNGAEWDAIVNDVIVQPISIWEAMIAPITRIRDMVAERVEKIAGGKATDLEKGLAEKTAIPSTLPTPAPGAPPPAPAAPAPAAGGLPNLLIGGTVAFAAAGSAIAFIVQTIAGVEPLSLLGAILALVGAVMAVSGFMGWLKLRKRDLATMLEACGWALNGRMRLNPYLAGLLTQRPGLPRGAVRRFFIPKDRGTQLTVVGSVLLFVLVITLLLKPDLVTRWFPKKEEPAPEPTVTAPAEPAPLPAPPPP